MKRSQLLQTEITSVQVGTYVVFVRLGSDVFRRVFLVFFCDRSLYDSDRLTDTGADLDLTLAKRGQGVVVRIIL